MWRQVKKNPFSTFIKWGLFALTPALYYYLAVRKDERWRKVPQKIRDQNFVFWPPGWDEPMKIPKDYGWDRFTTAIERALEALDNEDPEALERFAFNQITNLPNPIPTAFMTAWELAANYSEYMGRPIAPERGEPAEQYWNYTTTTAKGIGRLLRMSPAKIEYFLGKATGGLYPRYAPMIEKKTGLAPERENLPSATENPLLGGVRSRYPMQTTENIDRFYDNYWTPAMDAYESFTGKRRREPEDLDRYLGSRGNYLALYYALSPLEEGLSQLRAARELTRSADMPEAQKREKLERIQNQMDLLASKGNEIGRHLLSRKPAPPNRPAVGAPP